jgi:hypothetical protein
MASTITQRPASGKAKTFHNIRQTISQYGRSVYRTQCGKEIWQDELEELDPDISAKVKLVECSRCFKQRCADEEVEARQKWREDRTAATYTADHDDLDFAFTNMGQEGARIVKAGGFILEAEVTHRYANYLTPGWSGGYSSPKSDGKLGAELIDEGYTVRILYLTKEVLALLKGGDTHYQPVAGLLTTRVEVNPK